MATAVTVTIVLGAFVVVSVGVLVWLDIRAQRRLDEDLDDWGF